MSIYMKVPFAEGSVEHATHEGWISLETFEFAVDRSIAMESGNLAAKVGGVPRFSEIIVSKYLEQTSTALLQHLMGYEGGKDIDIHVVMATTKDSHSAVKYALKDALFSHYSVVTTGERPVETLRIAYGQIDMEFHPHDKGGKSVSTYKFSHNLKQ